MLQFALDSSVALRDDLEPRTSSGAKQEDGYPPQGSRNEDSNKKESSISIHVYVANDLPSRRKK